MTAPLRWFVTFNKVLGADVRARSVRLGILMRQARDELVDLKPPVLQQMVDGEWQDVPTEYGE